MAPFSILLQFVYCFTYKSYGFTITANDWEINEIEYTTSLSSKTLNIQMAACGNDGQIIYLFGGKSVSSPTPYTLITEYDVVADSLTSQQWSTWQSPAPTSFELESHKYAQFNTSSSQIYIAAGGYKPGLSNPSMNKFYANLTAKTANTGIYTDTTELASNQLVDRRWCTYVYNDLLYFIGGAVGYPYYAYVDPKDITANSVGGVTYNGQPNIFDHSCAIYTADGSPRVYVFGGEDWDANTVNQPVYRCAADYTSCYNISASKNFLPPLTQAVVVDELIFVMGGVAHLGEETPIYSNSIKVWDPSSDSWLTRELSPFYNIGRINFHVQWLQNLKQLVIIGGEIEASYVADDSIYIYTFTEKTTTTATPTTSTPTTSNPTTIEPTTTAPTTSNPTDNPTTNSPTTAQPTPLIPTTNTPTTETPTTSIPITLNPTTSTPTTTNPTKSPVTSEPTTDSPITLSPVTKTPTTKIPTTGSITTVITTEDGGEVTESKQETTILESEEGGASVTDDSFVGSNPFIIVIIAASAVLLFFIIFMIYFLKKRKKEKIVNIALDSIGSNSIMMTGKQIVTGDKANINNPVIDGIGTMGGPPIHSNDNYDDGDDQILIEQVDTMGNDENILPHDNNQINGENFVDDDGEDEIIVDDGHTTRMPDDDDDENVPAPPPPPI